MRALLIVLFLGVGCFNVDEPPCAYACGPNGECPDDYKCASDNYCHLHGTGVCFYPDAAPLPDQATAAPEDLSIAPEPMDIAPFDQ